MIAVAKDNSPFWRYVTQRLEVIAGFIATTPDEQCWVVEEGVCKHLKDLLRHICDDTTVFPYINPDGENGIGADWHADTYALTISVSPEGNTHIIIRHPERPLYSQTVELSDMVTLKTMRNHLHELSANVERANPNWRELFDK